MTTAHDALEAWQAGELPDAAAMMLTGATDAAELLRMAQSHGEPIRRSLEAWHADFRCSQEVNMVSDKSTPACRWCGGPNAGVACHDDFTLCRSCDEAQWLNRHPLPDDDQEARP